MAKATGKHPNFNSASTQVQFRIVDAAGNVILGPIGDQFVGSGEPYSLNLTLTPAQAAVAHHAEVRTASFFDTFSEWLNIGAPVGGFTAAVPGPPTDNVITNS